jgi:hypothetical protein
MAKFLLPLGSSNNIRIAYEHSFNDLNLFDVQSSFEHLVGFNLIFSILLDFVTVAIDPHSSH